MDWTLEQTTKLRTGRPTYGDKHQGGALTWLRTGKDTDGEYSLLHVQLGPGHAIPAHYHTAFTETWKVFAGDLPGRYGRGKITLTAGDEVAIPPGTPHGWGPLHEGEVTALVELRPAHEGFEKWVMIAHQMAADGAMKEGLQTKSFVHTALMTVGTDTLLPGPARVLNPLLKTVAWFARKAGVDRRLEEKYLRPSRGDVATA